MRERIFPGNMPFEWNFDRAQQQEICSEPMRDYSNDYENDPDHPDDRHNPRSNAEGDREISLGTSTILGIFFALALVCAVFFGFGYTMGRKSAQSIPAATGPSVTAATGSTAGSTSKPTSGSLAPSPAATPAPKSAESAQSAQSAQSAEDSSLDRNTTAPHSSTPANSPAATGHPAAAASVLPQARPASEAVPAAPVTRPTPLASSAAAPAPPGGPSFVVQVAAVSHHQDADVLLAALGKRGYTVVVRPEPQDKLLHVQLGPFASKKDAEAMRLRLLADGYNAIVK